MLPETVSDGHASQYEPYRPRTNMRLKKKVRRNKNMILVRSMNVTMKVHKDNCGGSGLILNINKKQESIPNPSYSMMHAVEEKFSIMMYICTHETKMWNSCVYRKHDIRLIFAKEMVAMWHES